MIVSCWSRSTSRRSRRPSSTSPRRAEKAAKELRRDAAEPHLIAALEEAERELEALGRKLMQQTYFAVPKEQLSLEPEALTLS